MVASVLDVWNQALSEVGARGQVTSLTENSKEATICNIHYNNTRTSILRAAPWACARFQASLTVLESYQNVPPNNQIPWMYSYTYPADCLKLRYLLCPPVLDNSTIVTTGDVLQWYLPSRRNRFLPGLDTTGTQKVILTNVSNAMAVYTKDLQDVTLWDSGLWDAVVAALQAKIVIPLTGNVQMKKTFEDLAMGSITEARAQDGNEALPTSDHMPDWISTRGYGDGFSGFPAMNTLGIWYTGYDNLTWGE